MSHPSHRPVGWVWAPRASRVDLVVGDEQWAMVPDDDGWYRPGRALRPGDRYGYALDGGPVRADPRSHWQPDGLAGLSAIVDHDAFAWRDRRWAGRPLAGSVIYELHVGTFTAAGTFDMAIGRLPYLADLGVTTIELMPVAELPGRWGWGYDGVLLSAVDSGYGGPDGLKRLVDAAHRRGLAVLVDVVYNHFGPEHCHLQEFGPYTHDDAGTPWGQAVNLDGEGSRAVRDHLLENAALWFGAYHVDGLRLDATHALVDRTATDFLEELAAMTARLSAHLGRTLLLVAEDDRNDARRSRPREAGGTGLDGQWSDDQHHAVHAVLTGERLGYYARYGQPEQIVTALEDVFVDDGTAVGPGDRAARGRPVGDAPRHRFVVCSQNHDQVGNRARGERLGHLVGPAGACAAATIALLGPGTPLLFQGEEWAASAPFPFFADYDDPTLRQRVTDGRRAELAELGWVGDVPDPLEPATRDAAVLAWGERQQQPHAAVLAWYRALLRLRGDHASLTDPDARSTSATLEDEGRVLVVRRGNLTVAVNLTATATTTTVDGTVLACTAGVERRPDGTALPPYASLVVASDEPDEEDCTARTGCP